MAESESVWKCKQISADDDKTVYESSDGYRITAYHIKKTDVYECYTVFENNSDSIATLEMLSSFCLEDVTADTLHRATSFWSAEDKILSQKLTELNMERSWSGHGIRIEKFGQIGSMPVRKWFPFVAVEDSEKGKFIGVQLYCPSNWQITLDAIKLYGEIAPIIKDGYTRIIECTAEDYNDPTGYQIILRELGDNALMIVHTFKDGANPPIEKHLENWQITKTFGSDLDCDFRGKAYLLER